MLNLKVVNQFKKDIKKFSHNQQVINELDKVIHLLLAKQKLPEKYRDHALTGHYNGMRECPIKPDVLLVYFINKQESILFLERLGSHSKLF